jgi:uncharacterized protein (TIGR03437 family)
MTCFGALAATPAITNPVTSASYTGTFGSDVDQREYYFTLSNAGPVTVRTFSYGGGTNGAGTPIAAGGFDPTISIFDSTGLLVAMNQDGGCGVVSADPTTAACWDAFIQTTLPAGTYRVVLTQSTNLPASSLLSDSFLYNPSNLFNNSNLVSNVPAPPFGGSNTFTTPSGQTGGFWDQTPAQRTGAYAIDIVGTTSAAAAVSTSTTLPFGLTGVSYSSLTFAGNVPGATYTWTPPVSGLPPGMSVSTSGVLSGTPTATGTYQFTIAGTDGVQAVQQSETIVVYGPLSITTSALGSGTMGSAYGPVQLTSSGGSGSVMWSGGGAGLTVSAAGVVSGTLSGTGSVSVTATDTVTSQVAMMTYPITAIPPQLIFSANLIQEVAVGAQIAGSLTASGGTPPYTFSATNAPMGLVVNSANGAITGSISSPGMYQITLGVSDSGAQSKSSLVTLLVFGVSTLSAPNATAGTKYTTTLLAAGNSGTTTWKATGGLPPGLTLSSAGVLSGTPLTGGSYSIAVTITDGVLTVNGTVSISVTGTTPLAVPSSTTLTSGQVTIGYNSSLVASGGTPQYTWVITGGVLPGGLTLSPGGSITGTPNTPGTYSFTAQVTDSGGNVASGSFTIVVSPAPLRLVSVNTLPNGVVGSAYPLQVFTATGGTAPYTFSISAGSLPAGLSFSAGQISGSPTTQGLSNFTILLTDSTGATVSLPLSIQVDAIPADLILSDTFLNFNITTGSTSTPPADNVTVRSSAVGTILNYTYSVTPSVSWLSVTGGTNTPGSLSVSLTQSALSLASSSTAYSTSLIISCAAPSSCAGRSQTVTVNVNVTAPAAVLSLSTGLLSYTSTTANPSPVSMPLSVQNSGGGALNIASVTTGNSWVTVTGAPTVVSAGTPVQMTVTVNPTGLPAGYNSSSVTVKSSAGSVTVPIALNISANTTVSLQAASAQFSMPQSSTLSPSSGTFQVSTNSSQPVSWSTAVQPGASWLSTSTPTGSSTSSAAGTVSFAIDPVAAAQLQPAIYYGTIRVTSSAATNSPQDFQVSLNVSANALPFPIPLPFGLLYYTGNTGPRNVSVYASSTAATPYQASASTLDGAPWLSVSPATGTASALAPGASTVSVNTTGLAKGIYSGLVSYAFSAAAVRSVNVVLIVTGTGGSYVSGLAPEATAACTPTQLVLTQTGIPSNFQQLVALPTPISVLMTDNCGNPVSNGQVTATFTNGDNTVALTPLDTVSGIYGGTWVPLTVSPQVSVVVTGTASGLASGTVKTNGIVAQNPGPVLNQNGVLHVYNPSIGGAVAPGTILQIYGSNLAGAPVVSSMLPLTTTLGGTSVSIGGIPAPLYYVSPTQINAQAPFELVPGNQYQVVANVNGAFTAPQTLSVVGGLPGIAGYQNGQIIAQHLDGSLVSEASPAQPGSYVVMYLAGLGATDTPIADGAASPFTPLAHPVTAPTLTLNGVQQPYQFVGLTPGLVGLYQINFQVPAGTANGDMTVVVSQPNGGNSNTVILPIHQ